MPLAPYVNVTDNTVHTQIKWLDQSDKEAHYDTSLFMSYLKLWERYNLVSCDTSIKYTVPSLYEKTTSLYLTQELLPNYFQANKHKLAEQYRLESQKYDQYTLGIENLAKDAFNILCDNLSELKFEASNVELTDTKTIKFSLIFPGKKILMISKPITFNELEFKNNEILYSFFINRKLVASDVAQLQPFIQGFKEYIAM